MHISFETLSQTFMVLAFPCPFPSGNMVGTTETYPSCECLRKLFMEALNAVSGVMTRPTVGTPTPICPLLMSGRLV